MKMLAGLLLLSSILTACGQEPTLFGSQSSALRVNPIPVQLQPIMIQLDVEYYYHTEAEPLVEGWSGYFHSNTASCKDRAEDCLPIGLKCPETRGAVSATVYFSQKPAFFGQNSLLDGYKKVEDREIETTPKSWSASYRPDKTNWQNPPIWWWNSTDHKAVAYAPFPREDGSKEPLLRYRVNDGHKVVSYEMYKCCPERDDVEDLDSNGGPLPVNCIPCGDAGSVVESL